MKSLDGEGIDRYDDGCDGEDLERIVITDREAVFDFITHLENPLKYISFRNLKELVEMELPQMFYERRHRTRRARRTVLRQSSRSVNPSLENRRAVLARCAQVLGQRLEKRREGETDEMRSRIEPLRDDSTATLRDYSLTPFPSF